MDLDTAKKSAIHGGFHKIERLDKILQAILREDLLSLTALDPFPNYKSKFLLLKTLYFELLGKMGSNDAKKHKEMFKLIKNNLYESEQLYKTQKKTPVNFLTLFDEWQELLQIELTKQNLDSPTRADVGDLIEDE